MDITTNLKVFSSLHPNLKFLKSYNVIVKSQNSPNKVKLISGGGSGHYPAHNGFIGNGILDGAICGEIYASPSVNSVIAGILQFDKNDEVLVIIKNYTGDRLNFGLAVETAKNLHGFEKIKILVANDDCSINEEDVKKSVGKRGLAGVCLIHKIAGAMSSLNFSLKSIHSYCSNLLDSKSLRTIGFAFKEKDCKLLDIEIGKGIHGEPGVSSISEATDFSEIIEKLLEKLKVVANKKVAILINDLGATTDFCFMNFIHQFLQKLRNLNVQIERFYIGSFLTSQHTQGISVTILNVNDSEILKYLDYEVDCPAANLFKNIEIKNPVVSEFLLPESDINLNNSGVILSEIQSEFLQRCLIFSCEAIISRQTMLNQIDSILADGDTGSTLCRGAEKILENLKEQKIDLKNLKNCFQQLSVLMRNCCGGSIGVLYSIFFQRASKSFEKSCDLNCWLEALKNGVNGIMLYGKAEIGDRTMIDAMEEGVICLENYLNESSEVDLLEAVEKFTLGCDEGCYKTVEMVPKSGRSVYTGNISDQPDPGAKAVSILSRAVFEAMKFVIAKYK